LEESAFKCKRLLNSGGEQASGSVEGIKSLEE